MRDSRDADDVGADGQSLSVWIVAVWRDLAWAGAIGCWFGLIAHLTRLRRGDQFRSGIPCLIADCLIGSAAAEFALLACVASGLPVATTVMAVCAAGYLGQAALDRLARRWSAEADSSPKSVD